MRIVSIIAVRNGADYIEGCLEHLLSNGLEVAVLDQMSNDGTYEICQQFKGDGLCHLSRYEYPGYFSLKEQLLEKQKLIYQLKTDWIVHQDVDELLESAVQGINLAETIQYADWGGFNAVNFNEFVFIPYVQKGESF